MNDTSLYLALVRQFQHLSFTIPDPRPRAKLTDLGLGLLCGEAPHTITSALTWLGQTQQDWSDDCRFFSQTHWSAQTLLDDVLRQGITSPNGSVPPRIYTAQDDSLLRKTGRHIPGVAYARDPLGPPFQTNLVLGQRFVQTSLLLQPQGEAHPWRALPVAFTHAPTPKVPRQASPEQQAAIKEVKKKHRLSVVGLEQLLHCRQQLDALPGGADSWIIDVVDGSYANRTFFRGLPERTQVVARMRKDAKLRAYLPLEQRRGARKYGASLPTPLEILREEKTPWQCLTVWVAGQFRTLQYKVVTGVAWPKVAGAQSLRLVVIKAAGYRLRKGSKLLYREPAFLITTDLTTALDLLIKAYLARWEIEVNFREEKTEVGVGQAPVRSAESVERLPRFQVACYSLLLWCCLSVFDDQRTAAFGALPCWRKQAPLRPSIRDLLRLLRQEAQVERPSAPQSNLLPGKVDMRS